MVGLKSSKYKTRLTTEYEIVVKHVGSNDAAYCLNESETLEEGKNTSQTERERKLFNERHYEAIAEVILDTANTIDLTVNDSGDGNELSCCSRPSVVALIMRMERMFESDNPNFDRVRFIEACGLGIEAPEIIEVSN